MYMSGIEEGYYCASIEDAAEVGLGGSRVIYDDLTKPREERQLRMKHMPLEEDQENPMHLWKKQHNSRKGWS